MSEMQNATLREKRTEFRNIGITQISKYRLPLAGKVSILHRLSGAGLFLLLPWILYLFEQSVTSELTFEVFKAVVAHPVSKLLLLGLTWAYLHHFCAGIRYLLLDLHIGIEKTASRKSAAVVLVVSLVLTLFFGLKLFGVL